MLLPGQCRASEISKDKTLWLLTREEPHTYLLEHYSVLSSYQSLNFYILAANLERVLLCYIH
jgi:hypothetical protein